jgi:enediyne polyketide synthase
VGAGRLEIFETDAKGPTYVHAVERSREGDTFAYDLEVADREGCVRERWEGLRLRRVENRTPRRPWAAPLLGPYLERRVQELVPCASLSAALVQGGSERRERSDMAIRAALGEDTPVWRRPDGKPEAGSPVEVSAAHTGDLTLAVAGHRPLGCDLEPVEARPDAVWADLLGAERFELVSLVARTVGEGPHAAATRLWVAGECLKKSGAAPDAPLVLASSEQDGWVVFKSGGLRIATVPVAVRGREARLVAGVLVGCKDKLKK